MALIPWNRWYSLKSYLKSALWTVPLFALAAGMAVKHLSEMAAAWMVKQGYIDQKSSFYGLSAGEADAWLDRIYTANLSFLVFTFGSLLVAIQVAGGQYTPRIIATILLRDNVIRWIVGWFIFTLLWANRTMVQTGDAMVPQFQIFAAAILGLGSFVAFLLLIDYSAKLLRPVSLAGRVGEQGIAVIESVYPEPARRTNASAAPARKLGPPDRTVRHQGHSKIVLAVNLPMLVAEAQRTGSVIEFVPQVGDFVAVGEPLFYLYGGNAAEVDEPRLRTLVAFGIERTMEQDPVFSFRILVGIAAKALSPAINDPTTAVIAIDQLHRLLRLVGTRKLRGEEIADASGHLRVIFRTPNWEDFVHISFREIRNYGAGSLQIARRQRAMIENLTQTLPEHRHATLRAELELLDRAIAKQYPFPEDLALAREPDPQGLGGSSRTRSAG